MPSTKELVTAVRAGEKAAFAQLVRLYERAAIITAYSVLHDYHMAQDAAQEGFVVAHKKLHQLNASAAFGPWLLRIVYRLACRMQRGRREESLDADISDASNQQSSAWIDRYEAVIAQLAKLPEHERLAMVLRYVDGHSIQEISEVTGKPVGTIKKQLSRALVRLRKWLREVPS